MSSLFPIIPLYAAELGAPVSKVGLIVAASSYATALLIIPFGLLSDKLGRRSFLATGLIILTLVPLLYTFTTSQIQLAMVRAIHGLGVAVLVPSAIATVVDLAPAAQRGKALGWYTASVQSGLMVGPIVGGFIADRFDFTAAFYGCSATALIGLIAIFPQFGIIPQRSVAKPPADSSWSWLKHRFVFASVLTSLFVAAGAGTIAAFIPLYGKGLGIPEIGAGLIITAFYAASAILRLPSGILSDKLGRKPLIICGLAVCATAMAFISQFHSLAQLSIVVFCCGIGMGIAQPSSLALIADQSPTKGRGVAMSMNVAAFQIGQAIGPTAMGFVAGMSDFKTMFLVCAASIVLGLLIITGLLRAH